MAGAKLHLAQRCRGCRLFANGAGYIAQQLFTGALFGIVIAGVDMAYTASCGQANFPDPTSRLGRGQSAGFNGIVFIGVGDLALPGQCY